MSNVLFITGSLRADSYNTKLLEHLENYLPFEISVDYLRHDAASLPLFNEELENIAEYRAECEMVYQRFLNARAFVVACPEYNGQVTAYLKNTIDWVSRLSYIDESKENPFLDKPILLCSVSKSARGGVLGIASARDLFSYVGASVIGGSICIGNAAEKFSTGHFDPSELEIEEIHFHLSRWVVAAIK